MSPVWVAFIAGCFVGASFGVFAMALVFIAKQSDERHPADGEWSELAKALSKEKQWQYGYRYGLMIGHAQGMDDAYEGRIQ